jgi:dienelactone hydrolase
VTIRTFSLLLALALAACAGLPSVEIPQLDGRSRITGHLATPEGEGPFPAVVLMHGCGGLGGEVQSEAEWFRERGFVVLLPDSFARRGLSQVCDNRLLNVDSRTARRTDLYSALRYLAALPYVRRDRIYAVGYSHGGGTVIRALAAPPPFAEPRFAGGVNFYGNCPSDGRLQVPVLTLIGERDDWASAAGCRAFERRVALRAARNESAPFRLVVYPGAAHAFNFPGRSRTVYGHRVGYDEAAAVDARRQVEAFLAAGAERAGEAEPAAAPSAERPWPR